MQSYLADKTQDDKAQLLRLIEKAMTCELAEILKSAAAAHGGATHEDAVAKSKYDTHGLELSYFAGSQYERARILQQDIAEFQNFIKKIGMLGGFVERGALVELRASITGLEKFVFISSFGSGVSVIWQSKEVLVLSPDSRLGIEIIDQGIGDEVSIRAGTELTWTIIAVL